MAPLSASAVSELLASHHQLSKDSAEVEALLHRLAPAWAEIRSILNELNRVFGSGRDKRSTGPRGGLRRSTPSSHDHRSGKEREESSHGRIATGARDLR